MFNTHSLFVHLEFAMNRRSALFGFTLLAIVMMAMAPPQVAAQETLTFSLTRNFGTGLGSTIEGTFTLVGSGPEAIVGLIVYFNGAEVHEVTGNTISWQFVTSDYPSGPTNITLYGWDDEGESYVTSQQFTFLAETSSNIITIAILGFVVIVLLIRYVPRFMGRGQKTSKSDLVSSNQY